MTSCTQRTVLTVREPALTAVQAILGTAVFAPASTGDDFTSGGAAAGARAAAELRAFYAKWRDVPDEERWMRILANAATRPRGRAKRGLTSRRSAACRLGSDARVAAIRAEVDRRLALGPPSADAFGAGGACGRQLAVTPSHCVTIRDR